MARSRYADFYRADSWQAILPSRCIVGAVKFSSYSSPA